MPKQDTHLSHVTRLIIWHAASGDNNSDSPSLLAVSCRPAIIFGLQNNTPRVTPFQKIFYVQKDFLSHCSEPKNNNSRTQKRRSPGQHRQLHVPPHRAHPNLPNPYLGQVQSVTHYGFGLAVDKQALSILITYVLAFCSTR